MTSYIDVHHHLVPDFYVEAIGADAMHKQAPSYSSVALDWTPESSLQVMDENGIASALLSISAPGLWCGDPAATARLGRRCNDCMAVLIARHPDRFGMFAALPLPDIDATLAEIRYVAETLHADGFGLLSCYGNRHLGDPAFAPVFDALNALGATVFVHPTVTDACRDLMPDFPASIMEFPFDTTRTVLSLLYSGTLTRCPGIRFVFSHAGGAVPFLAHRMARLEQVPAFAAKTQGGALNLLRRHYYDCALSANPPALDALRALVPEDHILYGSDFPFAPGMAGRTRRALDDYDPAGSLLPGIARANALALFPRFAGADEGQRAAAAVIGRSDARHGG
ncbi:MAG TPA: amidohydrolase family protein [Bordetella sp.]